MKKLIKRILDNFAKKRIIRIITDEMIEEIEQAIEDNRKQSYYHLTKSKGIIQISWKAKGERTGTEIKNRTERFSTQNFQKLLSKRVIENMDSAYFYPNRETVVMNGKLIYHNTIENLTLTLKTESC